MSCRLFGQFLMMSAHRLFCRATRVTGTRLSQEDLCQLASALAPGSTVSPRGVCLQRDAQCLQLGTVGGECVYTENIHVSLRINNRPDCNWPGNRDSVCVTSRFHKKLVANWASACDRARSHRRHGFDTDLRSHEVLRHFLPIILSASPHFSSPSFI